MSRSVKFILAVFAASMCGPDASCVRQKISFERAAAFSLPLLHKKGGEGRGEEAPLISFPSLRLSPRSFLEGRERQNTASALRAEHNRPDAFAQFNRPADKPAPRTDRNSQIAHEQLLEKARKGGIDVYFLGDSITRRWGAIDYPEFLANWNTNFFGWNAANFGWGADRIENMLWRLENGELDGVHPKIIVVLAGINNVGTIPGDEAKVENITRGLKALVRVCQQKAPNAVIILTALFPRNDNMAVIPTIDRINDHLATMANGKKIRYLNVNGKLADRDGKLFDGISKDKLHPGLEGYQIWADGLKPIFTEILGPPAKTDHAPSPTGDPSAKPSKNN